MKIFIPIFGFGKAGGFRVLSNLSNHWILMGHEVNFICLQNGIISNKPYYPTNANVIYIDINGNVITNLNNSSNVKINNFLRIRQIFALIISLNRLTKKDDIILANYSLTAYAVYFSKKNNNKFYYIQAYEPEFFDHNFKGFISSILVSLTYKLKLTRVVNSPIYFNYKLLKSKFCVYPGLDFNIFNTNNKLYKYEFNTHPIIIGCIGRSEKSKGTIDVINAYQILKKENINCKLNIAVFGNESIIDEDKSIIKCYPQSDIELAEFYKKIDILIAPGTLQLGSVHYPVIEAMSTGTPVITTGHYPSNSDNSWIVSVNSPMQIANRVIQIYKNPQIAYNKSKIALKEIGHLSWDIVSNEMIKILEKN